MKFKSILIENFACFYGAENIVELGSGLNVFIGDNGGGKSSMFNALSWCLSERFYDKKQWHKVTSPQQQDVLVNQGAKANRGVEIVRVSVTLCFELDNDEGVSDLHLQRSFNYDGACGVPHVLLSFMEGSRRREMSDNEAVRAKLGGWIDPAILRFMMFQGETLQQLVDFNKPKSLRELTLKISAFNVFSDMVEDLKLYKNFADKRLREAIRDASQSSTELSRLEQLLDRIDERFEFKKKSVESLEEELAKGEESLEKAQEIIRNTAESAEEVRKLDGLEAAFVSAGKEWNNITDRISDMQAAGRLTASVALDEYVFFKGIKTLEADLVKRRNEIDETDRLISIEVPRQSDLEKLIAGKRCDVCGSDAPEGSPQHEHMVRRLEEMKGVSGLNQELKHLESMLRIVPDVKERFNDLRRSSRELDNDLKNREKKLKSDWFIAKEELQKARDGLTADESMKDQFDDAKKRETSLKMRIVQKRAALKGAASDLKDLEAEQLQTRRAIKKLPASRIVDARFKKLDVLAKVAFDLFSAIKVDEKRSLLEDIERYSNDVLARLSQDSTSFIANLRVNYDSMSFDPVDAEGQEGVDNEGLMVMCNLAVLTAVLKMVKEKTQHSMPHVADAPTSALDPKNQLNYLRVNSEEFDQSIVFSKDYSAAKLKGMGLKGVQAFELIPMTLKGEELKGQKALRRDLKVQIKSVSV